MNKHVLKLTSILVLICAGLGLVIFGLVWNYTETYRDRIAPGFYALGLSLGGLTQDQAQRLLDDSIQQRISSGLRFAVEDQLLTIAPAEEFLSYDTAQMAAQAYAYTHSGDPFTDRLALLKTRLYPRSISAQAVFHEKKITERLERELATRLPAVRHPSLRVNVNAKNEVDINIDQEQIGKRADIHAAVRDVERQIKTLRFEPITIPIEQDRPQWTRAEVEQLLPQIPNWLTHAPFKLKAEGREWTVTSSTLAGWLDVTKTPQGLSLGIDQARLHQTLRTWMGDALRSPQDGTLIMDGEKVRTFEPARDGLTIDLPGTTQAIYEGWTSSAKTIQIHVVKAEATIQGFDAERLGIREVLGVGISNFSGSPINRRKNIALGAKKVNTTMVLPGQEFSLLKTLGTVNGENGWLKELVIKGDKTVPEYGGGLCQIGTTTFRAALASGLPITQRQNHSYRVRYYEPAGTDATIYEPAPDFRFKNDTGHAILISTEMKGDNLYFTVWGTRDGRVAEQTKPRIYNIVPPPPKKVIESTEIPVGTTKCTESAHAGADASFDYTVTYANGETKKVTFKSHYRPWGAVCLIGVTQLSTPAESEVIDETGVNNPN